MNEILLKPALTVSIWDSHEELSHGSLIVQCLPPRWTTVQFLFSESKEEDLSLEAKLPESAGGFIALPWHITLPAWWEVLPPAGEVSVWSRQPVPMPHHSSASLPISWSCSILSVSVGPTSSLYAAAAAAKSLQSCLTLCDPIDGSPPVSPVPGILQARTLEWVAISFSNESKWKMKVKSLSRVRPLATPWTAAHQAPPSMWFSRQEYWSGVPLPFPPLKLGTCNFCMYPHMLL